MHSSMHCVTCRSESATHSFEKEPHIRLIQTAVAREDIVAVPHSSLQSAIQQSSARISVVSRAHDGKPDCDQQ